MKISSNFIVACVALASLSLVTFLGKSYETSFRGTATHAHATLSLNLVSSNSLPQHLEQGFLAKSDLPELYLWLNGWIMKSLGANAWSAQLLTAFFASGCVILVLLLGSTLHSPFYGFISAVFFLLSKDTILSGSTLNIDPPTIFFILLGLLLWIKRHWIVTGIVAGISLSLVSSTVLIIFPIGFILATLYQPGAAHQAQLSQTTDLSNTPDLPRPSNHLNHRLPHPRFTLFSFLIALFLGSMIWIISHSLSGWPLSIDSCLKQLWVTFFRDQNLRQHTDSTLFLKTLKNTYLTSLPFLIFALIHIFRQRLWHTLSIQLSMIALGIILILVLPFRMNTANPLNPALPFLSFLSVYSVFDLLKRNKERFYVSITASSTLLMAFLVCTPVSLEHEPLNALRKFIPFIQNYGNCAQSILFIPDETTIDLAHEYQSILHFYTTKSVFIEGCGSVGHNIRKKQPKWVILSTKSYQQCLTPEEKKSFSTKIKIRNQLLLTNEIPNSSETDFTILDQNLTAVVDC